MNKLYFNYFDWLRDIVHEEDESRANFLNSIEYYWHFVLDKNRAMAGQLLRIEYAEEYGVTMDDIQSGPASVLEVLVSLSRDFASNADISEETAYHEMLHNLKIGSDNTSRSDILESVHKWLGGDFDKDGDCTPFPLRNYNGDARNIDLWTAMTLYIGENYPIDRNWINE